MALQKLRILWDARRGAAPPRSKGGAATETVPQCEFYWVNGERLCRGSFLHKEVLEGTVEAVAALLEENAYDVKEPFYFEQFDQTQQKNYVGVGYVLHLAVSRPAWIQDVDAGSRTSN